MDAPKVAVIICTYNMAKYLPEAINSALSLRYPNFEVIVVDDGSEDETRELIKERYSEYSEKLTYIYQENKGLFSARNTGIAHAGDAKYYSIIDADDMVHPLKVWDEVAFLEMNPDVPICFSNISVFHENEGDTQIVWRAKDLIGSDKEYGIIHEPIAKIAHFKAFTSVSTIRASAFHAIGGYDSSLKCSGDLDIGIRITRIGKTGFINKPRYLHRRIGEGMTSYMRDRIAVYMRIFDKVRASSSDYTSEELSYLSKMEKAFLMQALWGIALGNVDKLLKKDIEKRLIQNAAVRDYIKIMAIRIITWCHLAKSISNYRNPGDCQKRAVGFTGSVKDIMDDMSPCFNNI